MSEPVKEEATLSKPIRLLLLALTLFAFAGNSLLARLALGHELLDAATFCAVRLSSGAFVLSVLAWRSGGAALIPRGEEWLGAIWLALYAIPFSYAYLKLPTGTGALLLFGAVQVTMAVRGIAGGERPGLVKWIGSVLAMGGLVYLVLPGVSSPPLGAGVLMTAAGMAWGFFSLRGRRTTDPLANTARAFLGSIPFGLLVFGVQASGEGLRISSAGLLCALASGAVTSGLGYALWYRLLPSLQALSAASAQLTVPLLAAALGVVFLQEAITGRLIMASALILGGVAAAVWGGPTGTRPGTTGFLKRMSS